MPSLEPVANPLLATTPSTLSHPIPFDRFSVDAFAEALPKLLEAAEAFLERYENEIWRSSYREVVDALDEGLENLSRAWSVVSIFESLASSPELLEVIERERPRVSAFYASIPLREKIYQALLRAVESTRANPSQEGFGPVEKRYLEKTLRSFERSGAKLDATTKQALIAIEEELSVLTTTFSTNVLGATAATDFYPSLEELDGVPAQALAMYAEAARAKGKEGYRVTLFAPSAFPILMHATNRKLRESVYRAFQSRASAGDFDNRETMSKILELRHKKAKMLGYASFADYVLEERMAKSGDRATSFLDDLESKTRTLFDAESKDLADFARTLTPSLDSLEPWDTTFVAEKMRKARFDLDEESLRPYFSFDQVLKSVFDIAHKLYSVKIEAVDLPVWQADVRSYRLVDEKGEVRGYFYTDFFPRDGKRAGAWMQGIYTGNPLHQSKEPHIALIAGNLAPKTDDAPSLLSLDEARTVFHEFGHLLHQLLSDVSVRALAGTNVAWDFVELPSQIMENWLGEPEALMEIARHYQTGEPLPKEKIDSIVNARRFRAGSMQMRQLGLASLDLALHHESPNRAGENQFSLEDFKADLASGTRVVEFARKWVDRFSPVPMPSDYSILTSFSHLFSDSVGYAAGYYSYKWAELLDADAYSIFRAKGIFSPEAGMSFRRSILEKGDSEDPNELFRRFAGRDPDAAALLERVGLS